MKMFGHMNTSGDPGVDITLVVEYPAIWNQMLLCMKHATII